VGLRLPDWSYDKSCLLRIRPGDLHVFTPAPLPASDPGSGPVLHLSAGVRRYAMAYARLGLAH